MRPRSLLLTAALLWGCDAQLILTLRPAATEEAQHLREQALHVRLWLAAPGQPAKLRSDTLAPQMPADFSMGVLLPTGSAAPVQLGAGLLDAEQRLLLVGAVTSDDRHSADLQLAPLSPMASCPTTQACQIRACQAEERTCLARITPAIRPSADRGLLDLYGLGFLPQAQVFLNGVELTITERTGFHHLQVAVDGNEAPPGHPATLRVHNPGDQGAVWDQGFHFAASQLAFWPPEIVRVAGPSQVPVDPVLGPMALLLLELSPGRGASLVVASSADNTVRVYHPRADGRGFEDQSQEPLALPAAPVALVQLDVDGDSDRDVLVLTNPDDQKKSLHLLRNIAGHLQLDSKGGGGLGQQPVALAVADFDQDDIPDVAVVSSREPDLFMLRGDGLGSYALRQRIHLGAVPADMLVTDLDQDGFPDVAIADYFANRVTLRYGTKQGLSETPFTLPVDKSPRALAAADLNGDGLPELLVTSYESGTLSVLRARAASPRGYLSPRTFQVRATPASILAVDLDLDGDQDVAVAHDDGVTLLVLRNDTGAAGDPVLLPAGEHFLRSGRYHALAALDLDGDGFPELASSNSHSSTITILRNRSR